MKKPDDTVISSGSKIIEKKPHGLFLSKALYKNMKKNTNWNTRRVNLFKTLSVLILFINCSSLYAQNQGGAERDPLFTFEFADAPIKLVFDYIQQHSDYVFMYSGNVLDDARKVSIKVSNQSLDGVLAQLFQGMPVAYTIRGRQVVLERRSEQPGKPGAAQTVTGLVTDDDGNPLIGVTVQVKGTSQGGITDINGRYSVKSAIGQTLVYSYIGFATEERDVVDGNPVNVRMMEASVDLADVVVIGYGQQKKESLVASVNSITADELSMPTRSLSNNIAGQIAGVLAVQRTGEPGKDNSEFWIRGISSFAGGTSPLVLVDGIPRDMNDITVDEIETFTVLKDASATAVYGAEGANGVVLITTKRGKAQKPTLDVRAEFSVAKPTRLPSMLGSYDYLTLYNEATWESLGNPTNWVKPYSDEVLELYRTHADPDLYPDADFASLLKNFTANQRVTLNLRGGSDRVKYFVSGAFYNENGIFDSKAIDKYDANIGLTRYNIRSNIDLAVTKTTDLSVDMSGQYIQSNYPGVNTEDIFKNIYFYSPHLFPLRFSDGRFSETSLYNGGEERNPYNMLNESGYQKNWSAYLQTKITLNQKLDFITKGLSLKLTGSFDASYASSTRRTKYPTAYRMQLNPETGEKEYILITEGQPNLSDPGNAGTSGEKQIYLEASLNYNRTFNDVHNVSAMALYMQKERQAQGDGLPYKKQSVVGRASYGYDNRYMVEASFGLTGSENFAKGYRYGIFPAVGAAWYVSNEAFMEGAQDIINKLKLRVSYGLTGNDNVGGARFPYRGTMNTGDAGYDFGFATGAAGGPSNGQGSGITEGTFAAPYLSWEIEEKKNIGIDLGLLRGQIDMSIDYFRNDRRDILMQRKTISGMTGFRQSPWQNFGKMRNQGFDGNIIFKQSIKDFNLLFRGNITYAHNKILEYDEVAPRYAYQTYTGQILNKPLLYIDEGLYTDDDFIITSNADGSKSYELKDGLPVPSASVMPGDIKYKDLNKDGKIDAYDRTYDHEYYSENPEWVYGFGIQGDYKGFYAGIFFQGVANASICLLSENGQIVPFNQGDIRAVRTEAMTSHWSSRNPDNQNVIFPRLRPSNYTHNQMMSTWWYRSGNFIRLKNVEFGYNFDPAKLKKFFIKKARIYVQGNNLAVWDDIHMWDPELGSGQSGQTYPLNMTWTVGLELGF